MSRLGIDVAEPESWRYRWFDRGLTFASVGALAMTGGVVAHALGNKEGVDVLIGGALVYAGGGAQVMVSASAEQQTQDND